MQKPKISVILVYNSKENLENNIKIIQNQTINNIEIICVDNAAKDNAVETVKTLAKKDERIKLICLPFENENSFAQKAGLGIANGELVYFVDNNSSLSDNFLTENYINNAIKENLHIENNHLYNRNFLENDEEITKLVNDKVNLALEKYNEIISDKKNEINKEFDKFYQITAENMQNKTYEMMCRFKQLEEFVYNKENTINERLKETVETCEKSHLEPIHLVYEDISKVYDKINANANEIGCQINNIYAEISKNYNYTEELTSNLKKEVSETSTLTNSDIYNKLKTLEKEIVLRYVNIKRLTDMRFDELDTLIKSHIGNFESSNPSDYLNKAISENTNKLYEQMNKNNQEFYSELKNLYKELSEKIHQEIEEKLNK